MYFVESKRLSNYFPACLQASRFVNWWKMVLSFASLLRSTPGHGAARTHLHAVREDTWESVSSACHIFFFLSLFWANFDINCDYNLVSGCQFSIKLICLILFLQVRERVQQMPVCLRSCPGCGAWESCVVCCVATGSPRRLTGTCRFFARFSVLDILHCIEIVPPH